MFETYKPSGRFGIATLPCFVAAAVTVVALSWVYQFLIYWVPFIYINFLITLGFGIAVGIVGAFVVNWGAVRSSAIGALIGILLAVAALGGKFWFQYETLIDMIATEVMAQEENAGLERGELKQALKREVSFLQHIQLRVDEGWQIGRGGGAPIGGIFVYAVWLIEAGIVFYMATTSSKGAGEEPYSEQLGKWASEEETVMVLPITSAEMVTKIRNANAINDLLTIPIPETDESHQFAVYKVNSVEGEEMEDAYLTVNLMTITVNNKGEEETKEETLVRHAVLSKANREILVDNASLLQEAMNDYRAAMDEKALSGGEGGEQDEAKKPDDREDLGPDALLS